MRFKSSIRNVGTFTKLAASLNSLGKVAWIRLDKDQMRCTVIPEQGSQVWAVLSVETIFDDYSIQSAAPNNTINLEVPLAPLHRALRSAHSASAASIRLTKKDARPLLSLTILTSTHPASAGRATLESRPFAPAPGDLDGDDDDDDDDNDTGPPNAADTRDPYSYNFGSGSGGGGHGPPRETTITQDIPVRVLSAPQVEGIHEPRCRDPDVHILLPSLLQLKSISERFTKLALSSSSTQQRASSHGGGGGFQGGVAGPRLEIAATMHGGLRVGIRTEGLRIESRWAGLSNPELDAANVEGGEEGVRRHPSTRMKAREGEDSWAVVRVEGRDWGRVLGVGRLGGRVIACEWEVWVS
ncbi:hypothetical protein MMC34_005071 [Xylographa carneopallida]|nr:hypothetical protein [Xylographa carneopallida]